MGNAPPVASDQSLEHEQEELPHKLLLETHSGGKHTTTSLTCTNLGAILECDAELWFRSKNASVALSSLASKNKHACDWLTFDLQVARANEQCGLVLRANICSDMEGVAALARSESSACEFDREKQGFTVDRQGWYQIKGHANSSVCFAVEVADREVLQTAGNSFWRFVQLNESDLVRVFVCSQTRDVLTRPKEVSFAICFHSETMVSESMFIGVKQRAVEDEVDVADNQSDISYDD